LPFLKFSPNESQYDKLKKSQQAQALALATVLPTFQSAQPFSFNVNSRSCKDKSYYPLQKDFVQVEYPINDGIWLPCDDSEAGWIVPERVNQVRLTFDKQPVDHTKPIPLKKTTSAAISMSVEAVGYKRGKFHMQHGVLTTRTKSNHKRKQTNQDHNLPLQQQQQQATGQPQALHMMIPTQPPPIVNPVYSAVVASPINSIPLNNYDPGPESSHHNIQHLGTNLIDVLQQLKLPEPAVRNYSGQHFAPSAAIPDNSDHFAQAPVTHPFQNEDGINHYQQMHSPHASMAFGDVITMHGTHSVNAYMHPPNKRVRTGGEMMVTSPMIARTLLGEDERHSKFQESEIFCNY
jgi:hypothetical protein